MSPEQGSGPFSDTARLVGVVLLVVLVVLGSIAGAFAFGFVGVPNVVSSESRFGGVNESTTTIRTDVVVNNPNPIGLDRENATISHAVQMNGVPVAEGTKRGVSLPPGNSTRSITTYMENERIPEWWVTHIRRGERTQVAVATRVYSPALDDSFAVPGGRVLETDLLSEFNSNETRPVDADVPFREGPVLYVNRTSAEWGEVSETETPIESTFRVYNPLSVPIPITELGYTIRMNGVRVGNGSTDGVRVLDSGRVTPVNTTLTINATRLDEWWVTHLRENQETTVRVSFRLRADLPVVGTVGLPVDVLTYTTELETDLLGRKNATADPSARRRGLDTPEKQPVISNRVPEPVTPARNEVARPVR